MVQTAYLGKSFSAPPMKQHTLTEGLPRTRPLGQEPGAYEGTQGPSNSQGVVVVGAVTPRAIYPTRAKETAQAKAQWQQGFGKTGQTCPDPSPSTPLLPQARTGSHRRLHPLSVNTKDTSDLEWSGSGEQPLGLPPSLQHSLRLSASLKQLPVSKGTSCCLSFGSSGLWSLTPGTC